MSDFVILALAAYRIAKLLTDPSEAGPFDLLHWVRHKVGVKHDQYSIPYGETELGKIFSCIYCMSVWVGVVISIIYPLRSLWVTRVIGWPFGIAGVVVLIKELTKRV